MTNFDAISKEFSLGTLIQPQNTLSMLSTAGFLYLFRTPAADSWIWTILFSVAGTITANIVGRVNVGFY